MKLFEHAGIVLGGRSWLTFTKDSETWRLGPNGRMLFHVPI